MIFSFILNHLNLINESINCERERLASFNGDFHNALHVKYAIVDVFSDLSTRAFIKFAWIDDAFENIVFHVQNIFVDFGVAIKKKFNESSSVAQCTLSPWIATNGS